MLSLSESEPSIRKEVIEVSHIRIREASESIFEIFEGVDIQPFASLNEGHEYCGSMPSVDGAGKEPVGAAENNGLDGAFASIVRDVDVARICVETKCVPAIESVGDCIGEFGFGRFFESIFVKPGFEESEFWFCQSESHVFALFFSEVLRHTLDIKETFDYAHGKFDSCLVVEPGFFEAAVYMSPAIGRSSTSCDYPVEFVCAVREKNALEAFQNFLRVHGVFRFREIVDGVGIRAIAEHGPDDAAVSFTETFFDNRHCGGISQNHTTLQKEYLHPFDDGLQEISTGFEPAAHGGTVDGQAESLEDLFLAVERQVEEELIGCDFSKQTWTGFSFVDWLKRLLGGEDMFAAFFAAVLVDDMFDFFEDRLYKVDLRGGVKAEDSSFVAAAWACKRRGVGDSVLFLALLDRFRGGRRATSAFVFSFDDIEIAPLVFKFFFGLRMNSFAGASEEAGIYLSGLLTEGSAVTAAELFFQCGDASEEFADEVVAVGEIVRQFIGAKRIGTRSLFSHFFSAFSHYIVQYAPIVVSQKRW